MKNNKTDLQGNDIKKQDEVMMWGLQRGRAPPHKDAWNMATGGLID